MAQQKILIAGVVGVILLLLIGVLVFTQMNKQPANQQTATTQTDQTQSQASDRGTIQGLLTSGRSVSCKIAYPDQSTTGMVYVAGEKFRGDFTVNQNGQEASSHMIHSDGFAYVWTDGVAQGTKFKADPSQVATQSAQNQTADLNKEVDLSCTPWSADNTQFTPPSNVQFTDLSQAVQGLQNPPGNAPRIDPSICNQITDPTAKASCLKSLGGN